MRASRADGRAGDESLLDKRFVRGTFKARGREMGLEMLLRTLGPVKYERLMFRRRHGYTPNLDSPVRFNEKISARKLYENLPSAPQMVDKVSVRPYVASAVGLEYLNEVFQVSREPAEVDFDSLPEMFVAKANHGSTMNIFVSQRSEMDLEPVRDQLAGFLRKRYGRLRNEWWYDVVTPTLLFERYLNIATGYRFFVFHGVAQIVKAVDSQSGGMTYFDRNWRRQGFGFFPPGCEIPRPAKLAEMIEVAETLASPFSFCRVDLYSPGDSEVVFGELTLAPGSGWERRSEEEDRFLGELW